MGYNVSYVSEFAQGGMTEHGLMAGDNIIGKNPYQEESVFIMDKSKNLHNVNLDKGIRMAEGGDVYDNSPILAVRNYDADYFVNESGDLDDNGTIKRYAIEIQSVPSGDVIEYTSAYSEKEASEMIKKINATQKVYAEGGSIDDDDDSGAIQEQLDELVQDFSSEEYQAFCYEHDIEEEDAQEMSDFIYSQTNNRCKEIIQEIEDGYYAGGYDDIEVDEYAEGGLAKKRRRSASIQYGGTDKLVDKQRSAKPVGYRFTDTFAKKKRKVNHAIPKKEEIKQFLGKGIYKESRRNRSDKDRKIKL